MDFEDACCIIICVVTSITAVPQWSRVLEKLTVPQLVKIFPAFYGTRRDLAIVAILSQINSVHVLPSYVFKDIRGQSIKKPYF